MFRRSCYINEGNIDKPLLTIFMRRYIEPNEKICFHYQGGGEGNDEDPQDEGGGADDLREVCMVQLNAPVCLLGFQWW